MYTVLLRRVAELPPRWLNLLRKSLRLLRSTTRMMTRIVRLDVISVRSCLITAKPIRFQREGCLSINMRMILSIGRTCENIFVLSLI